MATYLCQKTRESSIEAIRRTIAQSKFSLAVVEALISDFPVGVGDSAMGSGGVLSTPGSGEGFTSRRPDAAGEVDFLEHCFIAKCVLIGSSNYFTAGPKRSTSSFHEAMILAFVFRAL